MSRAKYLFKETDITRALRAARKAETDVEIVISADSKTMRITMIKPVEATSDTGGDGTIDNPWDDVLNANQKRAS